MQQEANENLTPLEKLCQSKLSESELKSIKTDMLGFFQLLMEIDLRKKGIKR